MISYLTDNGVSRTWREGDWLYKQQPKFMTDSEIWALRQMHERLFAPYAEQINKDTIRLVWVASEPVTNAELFMAWYHPVLNALSEAGIRHGDLTEYAVLVKDNRPLLIDFAESRLTCDPRPDKRREGDAYWLKKTMEKLCGRT